LLLRVPDALGEFGGEPLDAGIEGEPLAHPGHAGAGEPGAPFGIAPWSVASKAIRSTFSPKGMGVPSGNTTPSVSPLKCSVQSSASLLSTNLTVRDTDAF